MVERWNFRFAFRPYFQVQTCRWFQGGYLFIQAKERCAFNCRFFRNVLNATGTAQGAGECWWDGGEDADGGGSFGGKKGRAPPKSHIFRFWLVFYRTNPWFWTLNQLIPPLKIRRGHSESMITTAYHFLGECLETPSRVFGWNSWEKTFFEEKTVVVPNPFTFTPKRGDILWGTGWDIQLWQKTPHGIQEPHDSSRKRTSKRWRLTLANLIVIALLDYNSTHGA